MIKIDWSRKVCAYTKTSRERFFDWVEVVKDAQTRKAPRHLVRKEIFGQCSTSEWRTWPRKQKAAKRRWKPWVTQCNIRLWQQWRTLPPGSASLNTSCGISAALVRFALSVLATAGWSTWTASPPTSTRATIQRSWKAVTGKAEWDVRAKESCPAGSPRHQIKKKNALCRLVTRCCLIGVLLLYPWGPDISTFSRQMNQAGNALFSFRHQKWRH